MSAHIAHEDSIVVGLVDGCPRCEEHAKDPMLSLDADHLNDLWRRMVEFEYLDHDEWRPRSNAEGLAMKRMHEHARFLLRTGLAGQDGLALVRFP